MTGATQVSLTEYNRRGEAEETVDLAGSVTFSTDDDQGRVIQTIQNYNATVDPALTVTTANNYNAANDLLASTSVSTVTGTEITAYVYGTDTGDSTPDLFSNDEIRAVVSGLTPDDDLSSLVYDVSIGDTTGLNVVEYTYDRQAETTTMVDQNLTTHTYTRNGLGALLSDSITVPEGNPAGINLSVISIDYAYKVCGRLLSVSSEDASGTVLNEVYYQYDTNGKVDKEYEEANGAVITTSSLYVGYGYDDSTTTVDGVSTSDTGFRPTTLQYPTTGTNPSRVITDSYGSTSSMDDEINQLNSILDGSGTTSDVTTSTTLDTFGQMGDGSIVSEDFNQPSIGYNLLGTTGAQSNLDQFGRVQDMVWSAIGSGDLLDGYAYTRNLQGDVTSRQNLALDAYNTANSPLDPVYLDQVYGHDALHQLDSLTQGKLSDGAIASGTEDASQDFSLDGFGNWSNYAATSGGTTTVDQNRGTNSLNQITGFSDLSGVTLRPWQAPAYDAAGNMTTVPRPGAETGTPLTCQYDAWDRLAAVYSSSTLVAAYDYDGLNRLIETKSDYVTAGPQSVVYDLYAGHQLIETRSATFTAGDAAPSADSLAPTYQYVWSANGSNVPILRDTYSDGSLVSGDRIYYLTDANDNVTAITNSSGAVQERYAYNGFGAVTVYSTDWSSSSTTSSTLINNTIFFGGMQLDTTTGLYYDSARWYNSSLGTFITTDPAQSTDNLYAYCGNDPIDETDPTGMLATFPTEASFSPPSNPCNEGSGSSVFSFYNADNPRPDPYANAYATTGGLSGSSGSARAPAPSITGMLPFELDAFYAQQAAERKAKQDATDAQYRAAGWDFMGDGGFAWRRWAPPGTLDRRAALARAQLAAEEAERVAAGRPSQLLPWYTSEDAATVAYWQNLADHGQWGMLLIGSGGPGETLVDSVGMMAGGNYLNPGGESAPCSEAPVTDVDAPAETSPLGGAYKDVPTNGGQVHHMPSDSISPLSTGKGPGIRMDTPDHLQTASWGSSSEAEAFRQAERELIEQGRFGDAQQMGIDDVRNLFGDKYDEAIRQMQEYTRQIPPENLKP